MDYCQRVKALADSFHDVGHEVLDSWLVLNLLRGLNAKFLSTTDNIVNMISFPSFDRARSILALKESMLANEMKVVSMATLTVVASSSSCPPGGYPSTSDTGASEGSHDNHGYSGCGGHHGHVYG